MAARRKAPPETWGLPSPPVLAQRRRHRWPRGVAPLRSEPQGSPDPASTGILVAGTWAGGTGMPLVKGAAAIAACRGRSSIGAGSDDRSFQLALQAQPCLGLVLGLWTLILPRPKSWRSQETLAQFCFRADDVFEAIRGLSPCAPAPRGRLKVSGYRLK